MDWIILAIVAPRPLPSPVTFKALPKWPEKVQFGVYPNSTLKKIFMHEKSKIKF